MIFVDLLKDFISQNAQDINARNFEEVYSKFLNTFPHANDIEGALTDLLLRNGINPLQYLKNVPGNFAYDASIKEIVIPDHIQIIGHDAFINCNILEKVKIGENVRVISSRAFSYCRLLRDINIPNKVERIRMGTFKSCDSLVNLTLPDSLGHLDDVAFENCSLLQKVVLPSKLSYMGSSIFSGCEALSEITYNGTMAQWDKIDKSETWAKDSYITKIKCTNGVIQDT